MSLDVIQKLEDGKPVRKRMSFIQNSIRGIGTFNQPIKKEIKNIPARAMLGAFSCSK